MNLFSRLAYSRLEREIFILWIAVMVCLVVWISFSIYQNYNASSFLYDDNLYMSETNSLLHGHGFTINVIYPINHIDLSTGTHHESTNADELSAQYPNLRWDYSRAPMFFILLASFFGITKANPSNWITFASIFNTVVSVFLGISYFVFVRKYFGTLVGIFSSAIIVTSLIFIMGITTAEPNQLTYLFIILSLLFISKSKKDYIFFGIFAALADLTNTVGIIPIAAYGSYLLFKREYKGFLIVLTIWLVLLTPWMIRDFYTFHDFGIDLGIPFSAKISSFISNPFTDLSIQHDITPNSESPLIDSPFKLISDFFLNTKFYHTELIKFFLPFLFITYLSISKLRNNLGKKNIFRFVGIASVVIVAIITYLHITKSFHIPTFVDNTIQILIILSIIIPFVIIHKRLKSSSFFEFPMSRPIAVLGFVIGMSILALYYANVMSLQINDFVAFPLMFVGLPLGIYGLKKIVEAISIKKQNYKTIIFVSVMLAVIIPISYLNVMYSISYLNGYSAGGILGYQASLMKPIQNEIKNLGPNDVLVHSPPGPLFLATGNPVITFPDELRQEHIVPVIWYLVRYNATYLVFDSYGSDLTDNAGLVESFSSGLVSFKPVFSQEGTEIWKIEYSNEVLSNPVKKAVDLEKQGLADEAIKIYNGQEPDKIVETMGDFPRAYLMLYQLGATNLGDKTPVKISQFPNSTPETMKSRIMLITKLLDRINAITPNINNTLISIRSAEDARNYDAVINGYNKLANDIITIRYVVIQSDTGILDKYYLETLDGRLHALKIIEDEGKYDMALKGYDQVLLELKDYGELNSQFSPNVSYQYYFHIYAEKIKIYKILYQQGESDDSKIRGEYDNTYQFIKQLIKTKEEGKQKSDIKSTYLRLIDSEIKYWQQQSKYEFMHDAYQELVTYDQFSKKGWLGLATTAEKTGDTQEAIVDYQYYLKLIGNSTESGKIQEKIDQLTKELRH